MLYLQGYRAEKIKTLFTFQIDSDMFKRIKTTDDIITEFGKLYGSDNVSIQGNLTIPNTYDSGLYWYHTIGNYDDGVYIKNFKFPKSIELTYSTPVKSHNYFFICLYNDTKTDYRVLMGYHHNGNPVHAATCGLWINCGKNKPYCYESSGIGYKKVYSTDTSQSLTAVWNIEDVLSDSFFTTYTSGILNITNCYNPSAGTGVFVLEDLKFIY